MCGICGIAGIESKETSEGILRAMLASIVHRGPDEEGMLVAPPVAVGTRRLSIIDLPGGSQPVWNEDATLAVVFNGEIYNFIELRSQLEALGHRFRTRSDTEVIVHAYEAWGEECVRRLRGMFAFAVAEFPDRSAGRGTRVFLARDPFGIKPLYYAAANGHFCFASEIKALLASGLIEPALSAEAVRSYLLFGSVAEPASILENVFCLPPGHTLVVNASDPTRKIEPKPYWDAANIPEFAAPGNVSPPKRVRELLENSVESHLVADVPVGVFLSSGMDSTALAALASRVRRGIHTFTVAFAETEFNEAVIARRTATTLGTNHTEVPISGDELLSRLDEAVAGFDQPSADGVNTYFVSWAARQAGLKVALSGLGSDELFGGYPSFEATRKVARLASGARIVPKRMRSFAARRIANSKLSHASADAMRKAAAAILEPDLMPHPYFFTRSLFTPQVVASAGGDDFSNWAQTPWSNWLAATARQARGMDPFTAVSWLELRSYMLNTLLRDTDSMSMCHSLEVRVPFLDAPLAEFVLSLPKSVKCEAKKPKSLLIEAVGDLLPAETVGQKKRTFTFPWEVWLRGRLGERVSRSFEEWSPALEAHVDHDFARDVWRDFREGRTTWSRPWSLFVLNEWTKRSVRANSSGAGSRRPAPVSVA